MSDISDILKRAFQLGFETLLITKENANELLEEMTKKGEIKKDEVKTQVKEILNRILPSKEEIESKTEKMLEGILHKLDIPTRHEFQELQKKLDEIISKLESKEK